MTLNASQLQRGLSLGQFQACYGTGRQCVQAAVPEGWPKEKVPLPFPTKILK